MQFNPWSQQVYRLLKSQKGFTFLEAILTTTLLSFGFWGGYAIFQNAIHHTVAQDFRLIATELASEKIELITADRTFQGFYSITTANYPAETLQGDFSGFTRSVQITEVNPANFTSPQSGSGYKRIDVLVNWGNAANESVIISTVLSDYS